MNTAERKYNTTERKALAVVESIKHYRPYLTGTKFYVHINHGCLSWLSVMAYEDERSLSWSSSLVFIIQQYQFEIIHRAGSLNGNADALSC